MATEEKFFWLYKDDKGEWRWRLYAGNNKIIADSGEGYVDKAKAVYGAKLVASVATAAGVYNSIDKKWEQ